MCTVTRVGDFVLIGFDLWCGFEIVVVFLKDGVFSMLGHVRLVLMRELLLKIGIILLFNSVMFQMFFFVY